ncbi:hypothetical protein LJC64_02445 [Ruminococcaceae bacterium OttesenSCG-928-A11]|nr:hypothetical protein [Ruminococcaceae bacterium OttesenSCG-928-A11]
MGFNLGHMVILQQLLQVANDTDAGPIEISIGSATHRTGRNRDILVRKAPPEVVKAIMNSSNNFTARLDYDGLHLDSPTE